MMVHAGILLQILNIVKHVLFLNRQEIFAAGLQKHTINHILFSLLTKLKILLRPSIFVLFVFIFITS